MEINDARPLWFSPEVVYSSTALAGLPRELKIVGRNLESAPGLALRIRLIGPRLFGMVALPPRASSDVMNRYVARVRLPDRLPPGRYRVDVSRDGATNAVRCAKRAIAPASPGE